MRHLPDFTAVRRGRSWVGHSKINAEAYVDRLVEAIGHKDVFFRVLGVRDEVAHQPSVPVNTGYFHTRSGQSPPCLEATSRSGR